MNRRNFLRAASGCAVAVVAAPVIEPTINLTGWVAEECMEDALRGLKFKTLAIDSESRKRLISFRIRVKKP